MTPNTDPNDDSTDLSSDAQVPGQFGPQPIGAVTDEDDVEEILGHIMMSTTGDVVVPREWLRERFQSEPGLTLNLMPSPTTQWGAYRRAMRRLIDDEWDEKEIPVETGGINQSYQTKFTIENPDDAGVNVFNVMANVYFPESEVGVEGGKWNQVDLGHFNFDGEKDSEKMTFHTRVDEDEQPILHNQWMKLVGRAKGLWRKMNKSHLGEDLRNVLKRLVRRETNSVAFRNAVYFIPARHSETLEALHDVWEDLNDFKSSGQRCRIITTPVVNTEQQRQQVRELAEEKLEGMIDDAIDDAIDRLEEYEDESAESVAEHILDEIGDATGFQNEYNQLLKLRLSVERVLEDHYESLEGEKQEIVQSVMEQQQLGDQT